jgi:Ca2+-binding RTX toxin-like protein
VLHGTYASYYSNGVSRFGYGTDAQNRQVLTINGTANATENTGIDLVSGFERLQFSDQTVDIATGALSDTDAGANSVVENAAIGTTVGIDLASTTNSALMKLVGTYGATAQFRFSPGSNVQGIFEIDPITGVITVADPTLLNLASAPLLSDGVTQGYAIVVEAFTPAGTVSTPMTFEIAVTPLPGTAPQTPFDADATNADQIDENAANGTYTGLTVHADDLEGDTVTYSLTDNAGGRFQIDAATGAVTVLDGSLLDYEAQNYWAITVRASDGTRFTEQQFYILVNDQAVETWNGTAADDVYIAQSLGDWQLNGGAGNDTLVGIGGNDILVGGAGNDTLLGLGGNDIFLYSGTGDGLDTALGGDGYDAIRAAADNTVIGINSMSEIEEISSNGFANVSLQLGAGNDTLDVSSFSYFDLPIIRAGTGNDTIIGSYTNETIFGEDGDDVIRGGSGADTLNGGNGIDTLSYEGSYTGVSVNLATNGVSGDDADGDIITGFENAVGSDYNDTLTGSTDNNVLIGGAGDDIMDGGAGNDTFNIGVNSGIDAITGGTGTDTIRFVEDNATLSLSALATVEVINATGINNAAIAGTAEANTLNFSTVTLNNVAGIYGLDGNDAITGSAGNDIIIGGSGNDTLSGGNGNDTFRYLGGDEGFDALNGGAGADTVEAQAYGATIGLSSITAVETIIGYGDTIILGNSAANTLNFSATTLAGIALIDGGGGNDVITGSAGDDFIRGGGGNDTLNGGNGNDYFYVTGTAEGSDVYTGGNGYDQIYAQSDNTTIGLGTTISGIEYISSQGYLNTKIAGTTGIDNWDFSTTTFYSINSISSGAGNDIVTGSTGDDVIVGGAGADTLNGGAGIDTLSYVGSTAAVVIDLGSNTATGGDATGDMISNFENIMGSSASDILTGNAGDNTIWGGAGNDRITGAAGFDTLYGQLGNDIFDFNAISESAVGFYSDTIADFVKGQDKIDVTTIDANTALAGDQNFIFVGTTAFSGVAGQLRYDTSIGDGYTHIFGDINGDRIADFEIRLNGAFTLVATDFIL